MQKENTQEAIYNVIQLERVTRHIYAPAKLQNDSKR